jgi:hypothetical protein
LPSRQRKLGLNHRLSLPKKDADHPTRIFKSCLWRRVLAGNLDLGTAAILNQDDAGTLPNTGSIGCVTKGMFEPALLLRQRPGEGDFKKPG